MGRRKKEEKVGVASRYLEEGGRKARKIVTGRMAPELEVSESTVFRRVLSDACLQL